MYRSGALLQVQNAVHHLGNVKRPAEKRSRQEDAGIGRWGEREIKTLGDWKIKRHGDPVTRRNGHKTVRRPRNQEIEDKETRRRGDEVMGE
jgi:hypothetical protein